MDVFQKKKEKPGWSTEKANKGAEDAAPAAPVEEAKPEEAAEEEAPVEERKLKMSGWYGNDDDV